MPEIHALAAKTPKGKFEPFSYDPGPLAAEQVEIEVHYCGLCHSDYSFWANEAGFTAYPFVAGHEAIGKIVAAGDDVKGVKVGDTVGLGWNAYSCMHCRQCLSGDHNLCETGQGTIMGRHGAFATRVRCHWVWATPIPQGLDVTKAGPLLCGGITVMAPLIELDVPPTARVGVVGIGGLGHMALQFANKWGCHVTAFTTSTNKADEAKSLGAHAVLNTKSAEDMKKAAGSFDLILSTVAAKLPVEDYLATLAPNGRFHTVGIMPEMQISVIALLFKAKAVSSSPSGSPINVLKMLDFCVRHNILPITEEMPMTQLNEALARLEAGKARYRIVLKNDLK